MPRVPLMVRRAVAYCIRGTLGRHNIHTSRYSATLPVDAAIEIIVIRH